MTNKSTLAQHDNTLLALLAERLGHMAHLLGAYRCVVDSGDERAAACADMLLIQLEIYLNGATQALNQHAEANHA
ncbi:hypothetical protein MF265_22330 [Serratia marcescens]|uniref:hypothetical protein n=1 Tax=Serratia marcescens TaxID=615 RepID=UPI001EF153B1|nr:hypothetical protein [Serratia marcescens]ULH10624.1 hypothetical protein MF265_22330 [Serratia marcescens]